VGGWRTVRQARLVASSLRRIIIARKGLYGGAESQGCECGRHRSLYVTTRLNAQCPATVAQRRRATLRLRA